MKNPEQFVKIERFRMFLLMMVVLVICIIVVVFEN